jgi:hypothetical protein
LVSVIFVFLQLPRVIITQHGHLRVSRSVFKWLLAGIEKGANASNREDLRLFSLLILKAVYLFAQAICRDGCLLWVQFCVRITSLIASSR